MKAGVRGRQQELKPFMYQLAYFSYLLHTHTLTHKTLLEVKVQMHVLILIQLLPYPEKSCRLIFSLNSNQSFCDNVRKSRSQSTVCISATPPLRKPVGAKIRVPRYPFPAGELPWTSKAFLHKTQT